MPFFFSGFLLKTGSSFFSGTGSRLGGGADWPGLKGGGAVKVGILKTGGAMPRRRSRSMEAMTCGEKYENGSLGAMRAMEERKDVFTSSME